MKNVLKRKNKKGFTLMEMLIVIGIIAILVAIAIPTFNGANRRARYAADQANVRSWYAEQLVANMTDDEDLPAEGTASYDGPDLQMSDDATVTVAGTDAEHFTVTYDPDGSTTTDADYPSISFPES